MRKKEKKIKRVIGTIKQKSSRLKKAREREREREKEREKEGEKEVRKKEKKYRE